MSEFATRYRGTLSIIGGFAVPIIGREIFANLYSTSARLQTLSLPVGVVFTVIGLALILVAIHRCDFETKVAVLGAWIALQVPLFIFDTLPSRFN